MEIFPFHGQLISSLVYVLSPWTFAKMSATANVFASSGSALYATAYSRGMIRGYATPSPLLMYSFTAAVTAALTALSLHPANLRIVIYA